MNKLDSVEDYAVVAFDYTIESIHSSKGVNPNGDSQKHERLCTNVAIGFNGQMTAR